MSTKEKSFTGSISGSRDDMPGPIPDRTSAVVATKPASLEIPPAGEDIVVGTPGIPPAVVELSGTQSLDGSFSTTLRTGKGGPKSKRLRPTKSKAQATEDPKVDFEISDHSWCCAPQIDLDDEKEPKGKRGFPPIKGGLYYSLGYHEGSRPYFEDRHKIVLSPFDKGRSGVFAVFDGHGGSVAVQKTAQQLTDLIISGVKSSSASDIREEVSKSFIHMEKILHDEAKKEVFKSGTTVTVVIILNNKLICANVGDTKAILCRRSRPIVISVDHNPGLPEEKKRIEDCGGSVSPLRVPKDDSKPPSGLFCCMRAPAVSLIGVRVWPAGLCVSRSLGDVMYKDPDYGVVNKPGLIIPDAEVKEYTIQDNDEFIIIASDGLWDVISEDEAVKQVKALSKTESPKSIGMTLAKKAFDLGSTDNITVLVIFLTEFKKSWD